MMTDTSASINNIDFEQLKSFNKERMEELHDDGEGRYEWPASYFREIFQELKEAQEESYDNNSVYLEDELGDVLWDWMCLVHWLENEGKVSSLDAVVQRAYTKFTERVIAQRNGVLWEDTKKVQKQRLADEHEELYWKGE